MAVALDAVMSAGNGPLANCGAGSGTNGASQDITVAGSSISSTGMTVGASATLIVQALALGNVLSSAPASAWNAVALTNGPSFIQNNLSIYVAALLSYLASPASGNQTAAGSWTGLTTAVLSCISFTGAGGIWAADSVATGNQSSGTQSISINTDPNGATVALLISSGGGAYSASNQTPWVCDGLAQPNVVASYAIGGSGSNTHTFAGGASASCNALVGIHVVVPGYSPPGAGSFPLPTQIYVMP
jgi:hypothetical protein